MPLEMSPQPGLQLLRHGQVRAACLGLHTARYPRDSINALSDTDDVLCEVHVTDAKRESFANAQAEHRRNRNDCAQWLRAIGDDSPHLRIGAANRLFLHSLTRQGQVCKAE